MPSFNKKASRSGSKPTGQKPTTQSKGSKPTRPVSSDALDLYAVAAELPTSLLKHYTSNGGDASRLPAVHAMAAEIMSAILAAGCINSNIAEWLADFCPGRSYLLLAVLTEAYKLPSETLHELARHPNAKNPQFIAWYFVVLLPILTPDGLSDILHEQDDVDQIPFLYGILRLVGELQEAGHRFPKAVPVRKGHIYPTVLACDRLMQGKSTLWQFLQEYVDAHIKADRQKMLNRAKKGEHHKVWLHLAEEPDVNPDQPVEYLVSYISYVQAARAYAKAQTARVGVEEAQQEWQQHPFFVEGDVVKPYFK